MGSKFEYVDRFGEYFLDNLDDFDNIQIYRFEDIDLKWLQLLLDFGEDVFGGDTFDAFGIVAQIKYGNVFILKEKGENQVLGIAAFNQAWRDMDTAFLSDYAISSEVQGMEFGTRFLARVLVNLKEQGFKNVRLAVDINNEGGKALYNKLGFETISEEKNLYGPGKHRYIMEKVFE